MSENLLEFGLLTVDAKNDNVLEIEMDDDGLSITARHKNVLSFYGHCCGIGVVLNEEAQQMLVALIQGAESPSGRAAEG